MGNSGNFDLVEVLVGLAIALGLIAMTLSIIKQLIEFTLG